MRSTGKEWRQETFRFIENYGFPFAAAWDGFHVCSGTKLKIFCNFKKRYPISNIDLIGYNKQFLTTTVNDPGSTHNAHLLKRIEVFQGISNGNILPNKSINLGEKFGEIPLVTVSDFPRYTLLVKGASEAARNEKERLFNETLRSARVVTKNCYGMFKERWRFLYKKTDVKLHNVKFNVLVCFS